MSTTQSIIDAAFEQFCHDNEMRWQALAEVNQEVKGRLRVCRHVSGFNTIRGERICRDCGDVLSKDVTFAMAYGGV